MEVKENQLLVANQGLAKITKETFLQDYAVPAVQVMCRTISTFPAVFESNLPSLWQIEKRYGYEFLQAYIEGWIVNLREFVNVGKKMTDMQTFETAMMILMDYKSLNIADINLVFKRAKSGYYGKLYDRLDGQIILDWFSQYFNARCNAAADISIQEAEIYKSDLYERSSIDIANKEHDFRIWDFKRKYNPDKK